MRVEIEYSGDTLRIWTLRRYTDGVLTFEKRFTTYGQCLEAARGF